MTRPPAAAPPHDTAIDRRTRAGLILYTVSALLLITGVFMISGVVVAWIYDEAETMRGFVAAVVITLLIGVSGFLAFRRHRNASLLTRDGFLVVVLSWLVGSAFGALPFVVSGAIPSYTDAFFETISGFTTTGASILPHIEGLPYSVLFWRSLIHWLGGMGIVVLTVAILPRLGIGGLKLMRRKRRARRDEVPGASAGHLHPQDRDRPVKKDILYPVAVFFFLYITLVMVTALIVAASGQDLVTAITTGLATVGNIGPGFGAIGPSDNYAHYPDLVKWWLSFAMLTGRLEVYSVLVLLTPTFWRN